MNNICGMSRELSHSSYSRIQPLDHGKSVRALVGANTSGCLACLQSIPQRISLFFSHRYADVRMFFRVFPLMSKVTDLALINRRIGQLQNFSALLSNSQGDPGQIMQRFTDLADVQSLLFYADRNYVQTLTSAQNPENAETIRQEIIRECQRAIFYQKTMAIMSVFVNALYHFVMGTPTSQVQGTQTNNPTPKTTQNISAPNITPRVPDPRWDWVDQLTAGQPISFEAGRIGFSRVMPIQQMPAMRRNHVVNGARIDIPGTFQCPTVIDRVLNNYFQIEYRNRIGITGTHQPPNRALPEIFRFIKSQLPLPVLQNAREIARLKANYTPNPHFPDDEFQDPATLEIMEIPVIDASHRSIQDLFNNPNNPSLTQANSHPVDLETMFEMRLMNAQRGNRVSCATCRHPETENRSIDIGHILVNYELQTQILNFLRARVGTRNTNTTASP
jgi:hypothetical protein